MGVQKACTGLCRGVQSCLGPYKMGPIRVLWAPKVLCKPPILWGPFAAFKATRGPIQAFGGSFEGTSNPVKGL